MKLIVVAAAAAAVSGVSTLRIPSFLGGQTPFANSANSDVEHPSDLPFHEELAQYIPIPDEYYESWNEIVEDPEFDLIPTPFGDVVDLGPEIVEAITDDIADEFDFIADGNWDPYYAETLEDAELDDAVDEEMTILPTPPEGSILGAAFDPPKFPKPPVKIPGKLPHLPVPGRPDRPDGPPNHGEHPHPPKRPHHPHPPKKRPGFHWPGHRKGPNPHFKYINHTIYEFLANSTHHKYLYKIIKNDSSLIDLFNTTSKDGKITFFAPTDHAFEKIIKHAPKNATHPPKWLLKKLIEYHTVDSFYPAPRVLAHRTIPTLFKARYGPNLTQKIRVGASLKGVTINFYAHPVFLDIFTSNGVIHAIDNILLPPPPTYFILNIFPTVYSTFFQALHQTSLAKEFFPWLKSSSSWTVFAPTNIAWVKIPLKITAWLFSPRGHHILTKLVEYHISPNTTFYTDSIWKFPHKPHHPVDETGYDNLDDSESSLPHHPHWKKQHFNTSLPTLASKNATLRIDEIKFGPFVKIAINGRPGGIVATDVLAYDGVIQAVDRIVLPPRKRCHHHGGKMEEEWVTGFAEDEDWTIENLEKMFQE